MAFIFVPAIHHQLQLPAHRVIEIQHVARLERHQVLHHQSGAFEACVQMQSGGLEQIQHPGLFGHRGIGFANRPLLVELMPQHLDNDGGHSDIHETRVLAHANLQADRDHSLIGSQDLQQLRLGLAALYAEGDGGDSLPCLAQIVQDDAEQGVEDALLDLGGFPVHDSALSIAAQQHFQQRKHQRSEEHTSELQSRFDLVCRLLLEKKNKKVQKLQHYIKKQYEKSTPVN